MEPRRGPRTRRASRLSLAQRSVQAWPSSATSSRSSGRLRPTTLWWSPSMRGDERAAEPVDGEGAGDVQRLAGRDVGRDLLVGEVGEVDGGRGGGRGDVAGRGVAQAVAGVQHAGAAAHRPPALGGLGGVAACRAPRRRARAPSRSRAPGRPSGRSSRAATAAHLSSASWSASSAGGSRPSWASSTPETTTAGSTPAARRVASRAGDARRARGRAPVRRPGSSSGSASPKAQLVSAPRASDLRGARARAARASR